MKELLAKLANCEATKSLWDEQDICRELERLNWRVVHGSYYQDVKQPDKFRESDVIGTQRWRLSEQGGPDQNATVHVCVEAKTLLAYHIVGCAPRKIPDSLHCTRYWVGQDDLFLPALRQVLEHEFDQDPMLTDLCGQELAKAAYPEGGLAATYDLMGALAPPNAPHIAGVFRETNTSKDRDLDSSVLWKGGQMLRSAMNSFVRDRREWHLESVALPLEDGQLSLSVESFPHDVGYVDLFHPVLTLRGRLWMADDRQLLEVPWLRLVQLDRFGHANWWFDVVRHSEFSGYAEMVTRHYEQALSQLGCTLQAG